MSLLEVRDLSIRFRLDEATTVDAVKGISFDVPVRSAVALVGESGSGKSVTALSVMGLLPKENSSIGAASRDRKSTRLNSSHSSISYAVFCLKKKNTTSYVK